MDCTLTHDPIGEDGAFGKLYRDDTGEQLAVTLEHSYSDGEGGWYAKVPPGRYRCDFYHSPKHGYDVYVLQNVPGHDYIEFHIVNVNAESDGCIGLGEAIRLVGAGDEKLLHKAQVGDRMITNSRITFEQFMALQNGTPSFWLRVDQALT